MSVNTKLFTGFAPLRSLNPQSAAQLARSATLVQKRADQYLFKSGPSQTQTYFLITGRLAFENADGVLVGQLSSKDSAASHSVTEVSPHSVSARCLSEVTCLALDSALLEVTLSWGREAAVDVGEISATAAYADDDWMLRLLQHRSFQRLPADTLQAMFLRMTPASAQAGDMLIRQGEVGDCFYVIVEGRCQILREIPGQPPLLLTTFGPGDCFGEDALLSGAPRNASVQALTAMKLLRVSQADFTQLLAQAWNQRLSLAAAASLVGRGAARWLDVRLPAERIDHASLPHSLCIPYDRLRAAVADLERNTLYICACDNGRRSAVAAFILTHHGLDAYVLENGLQGPAASG